MVEQEPFYLPVRDEVELFEAAYAASIPILLKGPTGTGKTRFVEYMAWKLSRPAVNASANSANGDSERVIPLITIACHEDLTASDLVGRYLLDAEGTRWIDGPLTRAVKSGAICYLDEIVEARKDTTVLIHPWQTTGAYSLWKSRGWSWRPRRASSLSYPTTRATRALLKT